MALKVDVVVVGGGVVGAAIAYESCLAGLTVALLDSGPFGGGTSAASFAWINATAKTSEESYHRLNAAGTQRYRALASEFGERTIGMHRTGMLRWADAASPERISAIDVALERLDGFGYPVTAVDAPALRALEPHLAFTDDARGLYAFADAWLDAPRFVGFLIERLRTLGAMVRDGTKVVGLLGAEDGRVSGVETEHATIHAPHVVVAAGADTAAVLAHITGFDAFASRFPVTSAPGLLVSTPANASPHVFARHVLYSPLAGDLHLRPDHDGGLLLGADDTDGLVAEDPSVSARREGARRLLARAQALIPAFPGERLLDQCELRVGVRPVPADGRSIVGALPGAEGLHVAVTHSGVTLAPVIARLMVRSLLEAHPLAELEPYSPARFQTLRP